MGLPLHDLLVEVRSAMAIWFVIVGLALIGCAFLLVPAIRRWYQRHRARVRAARERSGQLAAHADELRRYAEEVTMAAAGAQLTARRRRAEWEEVCRALDAAWRAYLDADATASRIACAAVFPVPEKALTPVQIQQRERDLNRSATDAYRRGELSVAQLTDILCHRNGWSPHRHPADQEVALRRIARQRRRDAYLAIAEFERSARRSAEVAFAAQHALQDEAFAAATRAQRVRSGLAAEPTVGAPSTLTDRPAAARLAGTRQATAAGPAGAW